MKTYAFPNEMGEGMTLRDWFAGQALMGLYSDSHTFDMGMEEIAVTAYTMADTMIKARNNETAQD